jgi:hypothetical protein
VVPSHGCVPRGPGPRSSRARQSRRPRSPTDGIVLYSKCVVPFFNKLLYLCLPSFFCLLPRKKLPASYVIEGARLYASSRRASLTSVQAFEFTHTLSFGHLLPTAVLIRRPPLISYNSTVSWLIHLFIATQLLVALASVQFAQLHKDEHSFLVQSLVLF